jgi:hypothetical protein
VNPKVAAEKPPTRAIPVPFALLYIENRVLRANLLRSDCAPFVRLSLLFVVLGVIR